IEKSRVEPAQSRHPGAQRDRCSANSNNDIAEVGSRPDLSLRRGETSTVCELPGRLLPAARGRGLEAAGSCSAELPKKIRRDGTCSSERVDSGGAAKPRTEWPTNQKNMNLRDAIRSTEHCFRPHTEQPEHIDDRDLELYLKSQLNDDSISVIDAHLERCPVCVSKLAEQDQCLAYLAELSAEESFGGTEKRVYPRVATDEPASLQVLNPFSAGMWDVRIVDVSKSGLRAYTSRPLTPGSLIRVKMQFSTACGDVRYCIPEENGFYAGVRLHDYFFR
ncbi:MAG: PilZ domain-containing protein, partial [Candidatus Korobacteraceae bacterium]